ncbi:radical SAM/SPASM domain-containing protein, partial [Chitinimonas sp.]|uniref:radical SAM protein n=1 Tax=Chitinimonas sp. TaxID=1934313 RepID=UPI0035B4E1B2
MPGKYLSLQLTWACDIRCAHCNQDHVRQHLDVALARQTIRDFHAAGEICRLGFTGGEVFLRYPALLELAGLAHELGLGFGVVTNGRWAGKPGLAAQRLGALAARGLDNLVVSYDIYHQAFVADEVIAHLLEEAGKLGLNRRVYVTRGDLTPIARIKTEVANRFDLDVEQVLVRDMVPVGHVAALAAPAAIPYAELEKDCPERNEYFVWPDGEVLPCDSVGTTSALSLGNLRQDSVKTIIKRRRASRLLAMLHRHDLHEVVIRLPAPVRDRLASGRYVHACHLCHALTS